MGINYDKISKSYDSVRNVNHDTISMLLLHLPVTETSTVLDFGCGTGNYADFVQRSTNAQVYGVEPSDGMREKAAAKNPSLILAKGNHEHIPFADSFFDFIYMTDVIHHIPDIGTLFKELYRVLKLKGAVCVVTESHAQIDGRFYVRYFPGTALADKKRYPDIPEIIEKAEKTGFTHTHTAIGESPDKKVTLDFVALVRAKGYSMFHLISDWEYRTGLAALENDVQTGELVVPGSRETHVWFEK